MHKSLPRKTLEVALATTLLTGLALMISLNPVRAAEPAPSDALKNAPPAQEEQAAVPQGQVGASALEAIIIQHGGIVPNPYKNPEPRLISDAWSQRT